MTRWLAHRPIRLRLTVAYASLFLAAGAVLLTVVYGLVASSLGSSPPVSPGFGKPSSSSASSAPTATGSPPASTTSPPEKLVEYCEEQINNGKFPGETLQQCEAAYSAGSAAGSSDLRSRTLSHLLWYSAAALGALTVLSGILGWIMAGRALRPVATITAAARRASDRHLGERIALTGPRDELTGLADAFDDMLDRLDRAFTGQRRFVANASHELRTPLTVMRTAIDVTLAKPVRSPDQWESMAVEVRDAVERAEAMVAALLALARSDQAVTASEPTDLATAVEDAADAAGGRIRAAGLRVHAALDPAPTAGDAVLLERMAANIVDNAVAHNRPGGTVSLRTGQVGQRVFLEAENTGEVIPQDAVPGLFEPFRRLDERTRPGSGVGVGLSIVAAVVAAHHGSVAARARDGGGLVVRVELPTADARASADGA